MFKLLCYLLVCVTVVVSAADTCRRKAPLQPQSTCGPLQTMFNEGECLCCYYDTKGIPTIGIGYNLQRGDADQVMANYGLTLADVLQDCTDKTTNACLTDSQARDLFDTQIYPEAASCANSYAPGLPPVQLAAVTDMAFMGCSKLQKFVNMKAALIREDWATAAAEARNSAWCTQVGSNRCDSDANCIAGDS